MTLFPILKQLGCVRKIHIYKKNRMKFSLEKNLAKLVNVTEVVKSGSEKFWKYWKVISQRHQIQTKQF